MAEIFLQIPAELWNVLGQMAPYLLFGFFAAGLLHVVVPQSAVERHLGGRGLKPVVKAALFGVPLPLCSCGVIPVSASLRKHGATRGATTSFLLATPQTGVDSIMVTLGLLGPVFAVFRPIAALVSGVVGGTLTDILAGGSDDTRTPGDHSGETCRTDGKRRNVVMRALRYGFLTLPRDIAKPFMVGLLVAGIISAIAPEDLFAGALGSGIIAILLMMVLGIPIYVCATASVPIAAALMLKGVSPGAALAFLIAGPATNAATITTVWKIMGRRTMAIYLGTVALSAVVWGLLLDQVYVLLDIPVSTQVHGHAHSAGPGVFNALCAVALLGVLAAAFLPRTRRARTEEARGGAERVELTITGMTCSHCAQTVRRALGECAGVASAEVDLSARTAVVTGAGLDAAALRKAVEDVGYDARVGT